MAKQLNTRIQLKHDFESNWIKASDKDFIPKSGEMIIYDAEVDSEGNLLTIDEKTATLPEGRDTYYAHPRMKIGDGVTKVTDLPFSSSVSSDDGVNRTYEFGIEDNIDSNVMFHLRSYLDGEYESSDSVCLKGTNGISIEADDSTKTITFSGNGSGNGDGKVFEASVNPPTNTNLLWIDTTPATGGLKYYSEDAADWVTVPVRFS